MKTASTTNASGTTTMTTTEPSDKRVPKRPRHVARSARILSTGISATAILGMTAAFGAAEKLQASQNPAPPQPTPNAANTPSALSPLGTIGTAPAQTTPSSVTQYPSTEGTVTLPTGAPASTARELAPQITVAPLVPAATATTPVVDTVVEAPANVAAAEVPAPTVAPETIPPAPAVTVPSVVTVSPVVTVPPVVTAAPVVTVAPIAPAEPPVQFTLPPAPSRGSSGGSR